MYPVRGAGLGGLAGLVGLAGRYQKQKSQSIWSSRLEYGTCVGVNPASGAVAVGRLLDRLRGR
jgi:hypothetical protein